LLDYANLFGVLAIEVLDPLVLQPVISFSNVLRANPAGEPRVEQFVGWVALQRVIELVGRNPRQRSIIPLSIGQG
jgi:hypothetical protein